MSRTKKEIKQNGIKQISRFKKIENFKTLKGMILIRAIALILIIAFAALYLFTWTRFNERADFLFCVGQYFIYGIFANIVICCWTSHTERKYEKRRDAYVSFKVSKKKRYLQDRIDAAEK